MYICMYSLFSMRGICKQKEECSALCTQLQRPDKAMLAHDVQFLDFAPTFISAVFLPCTNKTPSGDSISPATTQCR